VSLSDADALPTHYGAPFAEQRQLASGQTGGLIGQWAVDAIRIARGVPGPVELVSLQPGNKLVFLHLDGSDQELPDAGAPILIAEPNGGRVIGQITSAAWHYELGPIALAVIADAVPPAANLIVQILTDGVQTLVAASQTAITDLANG